MTQQLYNTAKFCRQRKEQTFAKQARRIKSRCLLQMATESCNRLEQTHVKQRFQNDLSAHAWIDWSKCKHSAICRQSRIYAICLVGSASKSSLLSVRFEMVMKCTCFEFLRTPRKPPLQPDDPVGARLVNSLKAAPTRFIGCPAPRRPRCPRDQTGATKPVMKSRERAG